jgi:hypothetical protein
MQVIMTTAERIAAGETAPNAEPAPAAAEEPEDDEQESDNVIRSNAVEWMRAQRAKRQAN